MCTSSRIDLYLGADFFGFSLFGIVLALLLEGQQHAKKVKISEKIPVDFPRVMPSFCVLGFCWGRHSCVLTNLAGSLFLCHCRRRQHACILIGTKFCEFYSLCGKPENKKHRKTTVQQQSMRQRMTRLRMIITL